MTYAPEEDGEPDPGEVCWAWVPYEDDPAQGKDRPVLVVEHDGAELLCLMLSSKDHDADAEDEARYGRHWMDIGTGGWDARRRPSEVRLDRLLRLRPSDVRREGAALAEPVFDAVCVQAGRFHPDLGPWANLPVRWRPAPSGFWRRIRTRLSRAAGPIG